MPIKNLAALLNKWTGIKWLSFINIVTVLYVGDQPGPELEMPVHQPHKTTRARLASESMPPSRRRPSSSNFLVLTWIAFSAAVFWAPNVVYAVSEVFLHPNPWFNNEAFTGLCMWLECATCLDPLMFIVTVPPLRHQIIKLLSFKSCSFSK